MVIIICNISILIIFNVPWKKFIHQIVKLYSYVDILVWLRKKILFCSAEINISCLPGIWLKTSQLLRSFPSSRNPPSTYKMKPEKQSKQSKERKQRKKEKQSCLIWRYSSAKEKIISELRSSNILAFNVKILSIRTKRKK